MTHGNVHGAGHVPLGVLAGLAHVHDNGAAVDRRGELVNVDLTHHLMSFLAPRAWLLGTPQGVMTGS